MRKCKNCWWEIDHSNTLISRCKTCQYDNSQKNKKQLSLTKKVKPKICKVCWKEFYWIWKFCKKWCEKEFEKEKKAKIREKKKKSPKKLYNENVELAKFIAKTRDKFICQYCEATDNIHWSHIINEARDHRLATNEYNIKALCYNCHLNWWHKNPLEASKWFESKFPWRYEELNKLHIEYSKMWKIWIEWHLSENERLKTLKKEILESSN